MAILLSIGDRVLYTNPIYMTGPRNPLWRSEIGCPGTIEAFDRILVKVRWDNGKYNLYKTKALSKIIEEKGNGSMIYISLKEKRVVFDKSELRPNMPNKARLKLDKDRVKGVFNL